MYNWGRPAVPRFRTPLSTIDLLLPLGLRLVSEVESRARAFPVETYAPTR